MGPLAFCGTFWTQNQFKVSPAFSAGELFGVCVVGKMGVVITTDEADVSF